MVVESFRNIYPPCLRKYFYFAENSLHAYFAEEIIIVCSVALSPKKLEDIDHTGSFSVNFFKLA